MRDPRERSGLKLLRALKREKDAGKSLMSCRPVSAIAEELGLSQSDFNRAFAFLIEQKAINAADRKDGKAVLPFGSGRELALIKRSGVCLDDGSKARRVGN